MTNPKRGEVKLTLSSQTFKCKINMDVLMRIETGLGKGILKTAQEISEVNLTTMEMIAILTPVLRSSGKDLNEKEVGQLIWSTGFTETLKIIAELLAFIITDEQQEGNVQEVANG